MMNWRRVFVLAATGILLVLAAAGHSQPRDNSPVTEGSLSATLDRESATVGSVVVLTLNYRLPEGAHLPEGSGVGGLEEVTILGWKRGGETIRFEILLDRLDSWEANILSLSYIDREGETRTLEAAPVSITVLSNLVEPLHEAQPRPPQDIMPLRAAWRRYLPWVSGGLAIALLTLGILWWLRGRTRKSYVTPDDPPHVRARKELGRLEARRLFEKGRVKEFYFGFSEIMRRYLESLRNFPAAEYTTEEIARAVRSVEDRQLLTLLRQADLVKFADSLPTPARKEEELKGAFAYIRETGTPPGGSPAPGTARGTKP